MRRRDLLLLIGGAVAAPASAARAQQQRRIGFLSSVSADRIEDQLVALRHGLNETGYAEGRNLLIEYRWAEGRYDRLPALAAELVRENVEVIVTSGGPQPPAAAMQATAVIPIVASSAGSLVKHFNRPEGNLTGVSILTGTLVPKRLEMLTELVSRVAVGVLMNPTYSEYDRDHREIESAARVLGV